VHDERAYEQFDSAFKVYPFLRTEDKVLELRALVKKYLPAISSNHRPTAPEAKDTDFTHAEFGACTLATAAWSVIAVCNLTAHEAYRCFFAEPARITELDPNELSVGTSLDLIVFSLDGVAEPRPILNPNNTLTSPLLFRFHQDSMTSTSPSSSK
jgi:dihydroorotase-like cyclic amidohydrolase